MQSRVPAIVCAARPHGETAVIARILTAEHGLIAGYVAGGRGRLLRPVLIPGNIVDAELVSRSGGGLPFLKPELVASRGPWLSEPLPAAAIGWATALTAAALPERHAYPSLHAALAALLDAICHAPSARGWVPGLVGYEVLLLRELGFGGARPDLGAGDWPAILAALDRSGQGIEARILAERTGPVMGPVMTELIAARATLRDRLGRMG